MTNEPEITLSFDTLTDLIHILRTLNDKRDVSVALEAFEEKMMTQWYEKL